MYVWSKVIAHVAVRKNQECGPQFDDHCDILSYLFRLIDIIIATQVLKLFLTRVVLDEKTSRAPINYSQKIFQIPLLVSSENSVFYMNKRLAMVHQTEYTLMWKRETFCKTHLHMRARVYICIYYYFLLY